MVKGVNRSYESKIRKKYSEFKKVGIGTWNAVDFKGRWVNMYTDEDLIRELFTSKIIENFNGVKNKLTIVDFGGGDGTLISILCKQLEKEFKINPYNIDLNEDSLKICNKNNPKINIIKQNLLIPYKSNFADVVLCRFVMQYQSKEEQLKIIENVYNTLKKGGLFFVLWPTHSNKGFINELESEVVHIITGKDKAEAKNSRYFESKEEMVKKMEKMGFKIIFSNDKDLKQYYTINGWSDRFNLTKNQEEQLKILFDVYGGRYPKLFEKIQGMQTHHCFHCIIVGKK